MKKGVDYTITKIEKGPLQRFKNQNMLVKRFGEVALQIYRSITGKRTSEQLKQDLAIEDKMFYPILAFMEEKNIVKLDQAGETGSSEPEPVESEPDVEPDDGFEEESEPEPSEDVVDEIEPVSSEEHPEIEEPPSLDEDITDSDHTKEQTFPAEDEIKPIDFEGPSDESPSDKPDDSKDEMHIPEEPEPIEFGDTPKDIQESPEKDSKKDTRGANKSSRDDRIRPDDGIDLDLADSPEPEDDGLSPVEKIIKDKYGDVGLQVYDLIDGQRTAEQIMHRTGLTEAKLVEILDFLDEEGIIKLDYPKGPPPKSPRSGRSGRAKGSLGGRGGRRPPPLSKDSKKMSPGFTPMIEDEDALVGARGVSSPVEVPLKAPLDIVKSVQLKAKVLIKFKDKGGKVLDEINGKNDVITIALKLDMPLYSVIEILYFMLEEGFILMKPLSRTDVRKKYGDDGYAVYKKYGKEGLMLYELIGKDLTIKQMADKVTTEPAMIVEMFIFIHQVLGIELPIDSDVLKKQLGL